ncbi:MAG TPA: 2-dehydropantoate 2-reductase [Pyrinomonadaceae bacterium]|jgi:2-dehydropantoate 2-reductase
MTDNNSRFRIAVVGIGGVGGFVGGRLAARFADSEEVEIVLAARGANARAIRAEGLRLVTTKGAQTVEPRLVSANEIGAPDLLVLCTKEYDLEETIATLENSIGARTAILPLLNGVDTRERIARGLPEADVWRGCIYIISRLVAPGVVEETGDISLIYFGDGSAGNEKTRRVETIFREAGVDAHFAENIEARIWEKFLFLSPLAASTSYLDARTREVFGDPEGKKLFDDLLAEIKLLARAKNIAFSEDAVGRSVEKLNNVPPEATSSMHNDFSRGRQTELETLVGYVVREARRLGVPVPIYEQIYGALIEKLKAAAG